MTLPNQYKDLLERGDIKKLVKITGRKRSTIYNLLSGDECKSNLVYNKMDAFFRSRIKELENSKSHETEA